VTGPIAVKTDAEVAAQVQLVTAKASDVQAAADQLNAALAEAKRQGLKVELDIRRDEVRVTVYQRL
jgi:hypothetical protein